MRRLAPLIALLTLLSGCGRGAKHPEPLPPEPEPAGGGLKSVEAFAPIADPKERSAAMFLEASRVLMHPRCLNCHPAGDSPLQGDAMRVHEPPVVRGIGNRGVVGMECTSCHQDHNLELARVPGAPDWHLAPIEMAWVGKTPRQICEQLKDPARNGRRTLEKVAEHSERDELVAWGWKPGSGREPVPGTQAGFGALIRAWGETGASCPEEGKTP